MKETNTQTVDRLSKFIHVDQSCWRWTGTIDTNGYGRIRHWRQDGTPYVALAHRAVYEAWVGPIPVGLEIDHLCRNRACVNPDHLEPVTRRENILRGIAPAAVNARKTHCIHGHPFDDANTRISRWGGRIRRVCLTCKALIEQRRPIQLRPNRRRTPRKKSLSTPTN